MSGRVEMTEREFDERYKGGAVFGLPVDDRPPVDLSAKRSRDERTIERQRAIIEKQRIVFNTPSRPYYPRIRWPHGGLLVLSLLGWMFQIPGLMWFSGSFLLTIFLYDFHQLRVLHGQIWTQMDRLCRALDLDINGEDDEYAPE